MLSKYISIFIGGVCSLAGVVSHFYTTRDTAFLEIIREHPKIAIDTHIENGIRQHNFPEFVSVQPSYKLTQEYINIKKLAFGAWAACEINDADDRRMCLQKVLDKIDESPDYLKLIQNPKFKG